MNSTQPTLFMLRQTPHWSFSRIDGLIGHCSLKWAFRYVYGKEPLHTPVTLVFGSVFHAALSFAFSRLARGQDIAPDECTELFGDLLSKRIKEETPPVKCDDDETIDTLIETGRRMLAAYLAAVNPAEKILGVGVPFSVPLQDANGDELEAPLIGEFDLLVEKDGRPIVVDWKTSARRWSPDRARVDLQPTCYLYARWLETSRQDDLFRFDVITKGKTAACESHTTRRNIDDFDRLVELVRRLERLANAEAFVPCDSSWECKSCPHSLACQSWHREHATIRIDLAIAA